MRKQKKVLVLSSSLLTDRVLLFSTFSEALVPHAEAEVWLSSYPQNVALWKSKGFVAAGFPAVNRLSTFYNLLKKINNYAWSVRLNAVSIKSLQRLNKELGAEDHGPLPLRWASKLAIVLGKIIGHLGLQSFFEKILLPRLVHAANSPEARTRLQAAKPDLLVTTNPMWGLETAVALEAQALGIPIFSFIPSWDNITTKSRFAFKAVAYSVWSNLRKEELYTYYPYTQNKAVYVIGAPQYDVFFMPQYEESRTDFCQKNGLDPQLPIVLYALGSPMFIKSELATALDVISAMNQAGKLNRYQVLVRPHPHKQNNELVAELASFHRNVHIQDVGGAGLPSEKRSQSEVKIIDWISTIKHADVIVNLSSTILLDGAMFDKTSLNINFDHSPEGTYNQFIKQLRTWPHLKTVSDSGAVLYSNAVSEVLSNIDEVLEAPATRLEQIKRLRTTIVNNEDGQSGVKMANAILNCLHLQAK
ncbi:MAG: hypothetical protein EAY75_08250 [Bacteroidetes bacterium]|nr:MAG: hypothetical protein EAY75_08250 [Bacteroidota bacterium]